jgi:hypothetical protein
MSASQPELLAPQAKLGHAMRENLVGYHQSLLDDNYYPLSRVLDRNQKRR